MADIKKEAVPEFAVQERASKIKLNDIKKLRKLHDTEIYLQDYIHALMNEIKDIKLALNFIVIFLLIVFFISLFRAF